MGKAASVKEVIGGKLFVATPNWWDATDGKPGIWGEYYHQKTTYGLVNLGRNPYKLKKGWGAGSEEAEAKALPNTDILVGIGHSELWVKQGDWLFHFGCPIYNISLYITPGIEVQHHDCNEVCIYYPSGPDETPEYYLKLIWDNWAKNLVESNSTIKSGFVEKGLLNKVIALLPRP